MNDRPTALITGATSGIGLALARILSIEYSLVLTGRREASECADELPPGAQYVKADFSDPQAAVAEIEAAMRTAGLSRLDRLIINAGTGYYAPVDREDSAMIRETLDVNLAAPVLLTRHMVPFLEAAGGKVVFIGTVAHRGSPNMPAYSASKAGLAGLARSLRSEWEGRIGVQIIHPGPTRTAMHKKAGYPGGSLERFFFSADGMAEEIIRLMERDRLQATVMLRAGFRRLLTGKWS
ncbi:SDR family NAD(P)-dependent oxidoreductase [Hoeflea sp. TYP-13]|uniref:SDR family NAD(P)-dependent oxidoreductase n=1 Tax=Hoeflea sp. TYP-13 TaxID=3230023 RepID=UPI0034C5B9CD